MLKEVRQTNSGEAKVLHCEQRTGKNQVNKFMGIRYEMERSAGSVPLHPLVALFY